MSRTLVSYASKRGSTEEVAVAIAASLRAAGHDIDLLSAEAAVVAGPQGYDSIVIGGSLYMGHWHATACKFVRRHHAALSRLPLAVFALGPRTSSAEDLASSRKQLNGALNRLKIEPRLVTVFGGAVDPTKLHFPLNRMPQSDARDWQAIDAWAGEISALISETSAVPVF
jgi:menaquinone-dependent protoporphyrinogen oxidase